MENYFVGITNMQDLKLRYRELAKRFHPDLNPDAGDEVMQHINAQYDDLAATMARTTPQGNPATPQEECDARDIAQAYREIIMRIISIDGLTIELCGTWIWISGETYEHRAELKASGLYWSAKKSMWYWRPQEEAQHFNRRAHTMDYIRAKYGSAKVVSNDGKEDVLSSRDHITA